MFLSSIPILLLQLALAITTSSSQQIEQNNLASNLDSTNGRPQINGRIADFAMKALSTFKRFMKEGSAEIGLPVLDPIQVESFNYSLVNSPVGFGMQIHFDGPILTGLSNYDLASASELNTVEGNKLLMNIVFPSIQIKGSYLASGNLFGVFPLSGQGDFDIVGLSQVLSAEAKLSTHPNDTVLVHEIKSQFVGGRVKAQFTDSTTIGPFAGLLGEFLSAMGSQVFDTKLKPVITLSMNDYTKEWLNGAFNSVKLSELLGQQPVQVQDQSNTQQVNHITSTPLSISL